MEASTAQELQLIEQIKLINEKTKAIDNEIEDIKKTIQEFKDETNKGNFSISHLSKSLSLKGKLTDTLPAIRNTYDSKCEKFLKYCTVSQELTMKKKELEKLLGCRFPIVENYVLHCSTPSEIKLAVFEIQELEKGSQDIDKKIQEFKLTSKYSTQDNQISIMIKCLFILIGVSVAFSVKRLILNYT